VRDSDGTVVFTLAKAATGGSRKTIEIARRLKKPCLHLAKEAEDDAVALLLDFIAEHGIRILNVAGSRESKEPGIVTRSGSVAWARRSRPPKRDRRRSAVPALPRRAPMSSASLRAPVPAAQSRDCGS